ncbi:MAG TPA: hypothetical protein VG013_26355 [Gemmataceae bacterium]|jgi:hypothetical protein|nr:hypothetical protein [Gemmataceae bacterium]
MWWCIMASMLAAADPDAVRRIGNPSYAELAPPVQLQAGGQPINVDMGHSAPFVADLKGDGKMVLLVGQFGDGKLRLYPNIGTKNNPKFDKFEWFQAGGKVASVPFG